MGITHAFEAVIEDGLWYMVHQDDSGCALWEAWAWEGQSEPPSTFKQNGYRWRQCGQAVHLTKEA